MTHSLSSPVIPDGEYAELLCSAFSVNGSRGNEAMVVAGGTKLSDDAMREVARRRRLETAFILPSRTADAAIRFRYFAPAAEMSMCVHGTIGAVAAMAVVNPSLPERFFAETAIGLIPIRWGGKDGATMVTVGQMEPTLGPILTDPGIVADILGVASTDLHASLPVQWASASRPKLIVPISTLEAPDRIKPKAEAISSFCERFDSTGIYAVAFAPRAPDRECDARQFPARAGFIEDPATGVAAAALTGYLVVHTAVGLRDGTHTYRIGQGDAMGRPCMIIAQAIVLDGRFVSSSVTGEGKLLEGCKATPEHDAPAA